MPEKGKQTPSEGYVEMGWLSTSQTFPPCPQTEVRAFTPPAQAEGPTCKLARGGVTSRPRGIPKEFHAGENGTACSFNHAYTGHKKRAL